MSYTKEVPDNPAQSPRLKTIQIKVIMQVGDDTSCL